MKLTNDINVNVEKLREELNLGKSFDVIERIIEIHSHKYYFYFLDGFVKDTNMEYVSRDIYNLSEKDFNSIKHYLQLKLLLKMILVI